MSNNRIVQSCYVKYIDYEINGKQIENAELDKGTSLNVKTLHAVLGELIKEGYGDYGVSVGYDCDCASTGIRNQFDINAKHITFKEMS